MVISRKAVEEFLARPLRDSSRSKRFNKEEIAELFDAKGFDTITRPRYAQMVCTLLGMRYPSYLFLLGLGAGKTKISLDLFRIRRKEGKVKRCLVLVPNTVNLTAWALEADVHATDCEVVALDQSGTAARQKVFYDQGDILVATYAGFTRFVTKTNAKTKKWNSDPKAIKEAAKCFDMVVLDEITSIKNPTSLFFRVIRSFCRHIEYRYGLTGTPFNKNPGDLWSQFFVIDEGYSLGESITLYRQAFFKEQYNYFGGKTYSLDKKKTADLTRRLQHCAVQFSEQECQDLPESVGGIHNEWMVRPYTLSKQQAAFVRKTAEEIRRARGDYTEVKNTYVTMRKALSGWVSAGDDVEKVSVAFPQNGKMDALVDLISEVPEGEKVIVVAWFQASCDLIAARLNKEKITNTIINGKTAKGAKKTRLLDFSNTNKYQVLIASTALSKGVNLQAASRFMVFFESPDSTIERKQMEGRIRREGGLKGRRYYYDLVAPKSVEEKILDSLRGGADLHMKLIVDWAGVHHSV